MRWVTVLGSHHLFLCLFGHPYVNLLLFYWKLLYDCLILSNTSATSAGNTEAERPYYIRRRPVILVSQPLDGNLGCEDSVSLTCEAMGMEPIISGWWPNIYWRHNESTVNSTWPGNVTIDTNYWNMTTLHTSFPGTYQCIVDDGSFILASRLATVKGGEYCLSFHFISMYVMILTYTPKCS